MTSDLPSLTVAWVALDHGVGGLEAGVGDLSHVQRLVVSLLRRDDRGVSHKGEVNPEESSLNEETLNSCQKHLVASVSTYKSQKPIFFFIIGFW